MHPCLSSACCCCAAGTWEEMSRVVQACEGSGPLRRLSGQEFSSPGRDGRVSIPLPSPHTVDEHVQHAWHVRVVPKGPVHDRYLSK